MKHILFIIFGLTLLLSSCTTECEKTLNGTVLDAMTGEPLSNVHVWVEASHELGNFDLSNSRSVFEADTDESGNFQFNSSDDIISWGNNFKITGAPNYFMLEPEFATSSLETCGENHVRIPMHKLSHVLFKFIDDPEIDYDYARIHTSILYHFDIEDKKGTLGESILIPVLEEIPNRIKIRYHKYDECTTKEITVDVPRDEVLEVEIGL